MESKDICLVYKTLFRQGWVSFDISKDSEFKIDSLVANINGVNFDVPNYKTKEEKLVAYLFFIIKAHAFSDGNKRTASIVFEVLCEINDVVPNYKGFTLDQWVVYIEGFKGDHQRHIKMLSEFFFTK